MKIQRVALFLSAANLVLLAFQMAQLRAVSAESEPSILRGTGMEIVDAQGRMRAQLTLAPGDPDFKMPDGTTGYAETVIFRLITADGKPRVKLTTSDDGSGLMLLGDSDTTHTILQADGQETSLKLRNDEADQKIVKP